MYHQTEKVKAKPNRNQANITFTKGFVQRSAGLHEPIDTNFGTILIFV